MKQIITHSPNGTFTYLGNDQKESLLVKVSKLIVAGIIILVSVGSVSYSFYSMII